MQSDRGQQFADLIAEHCYKQYQQLPKTGKPQTVKEWTLMAAVVMTTENQSGNKRIDETIEVVAMGTGSKCIGQSFLSSKGDILNDSHAEVLARRAFISYLYDQLAVVYSGQNSQVLEITENFRVKVKNGVKFHLFSSHTPCGDASIFPKSGTDGDNGFVVDSHMYTPSHDQTHHTTPDKNQCQPHNTQDRSHCQQSSQVEGQGQHKIQGEGHGHHNPQDEDQAIKGMDHISRQAYDELSVNDFHKSQGLESEMSQKKRKMYLDGVGEAKKLKTVSEENETTIGLPNFDIRSTELKQKIDLELLEQQHTSPDIYRTGAKCVPGGGQDRHESGKDYHTVGVLRTKPGRGDRTLSLSCSDKMARWNVVGCQGALLSHFLLHPIYFDTVVIGRCPFNQAALDRAVIQRCKGVLSLPSGFRLGTPELLQASKEFVDSKNAAQQRNDSVVMPCPASIIWHKRQRSDLYEVVINGRRQGFTKKMLNSPKARSAVCSLELFHRFMKTLEILTKGRHPPTLRFSRELRDITYAEYKTMATEYQLAWRCLTQHGVFKCWVYKPVGLSSFLCNK